MGLRSRDVLSLLDDKTCDYEDRVALGIKDTFGWKEFTYRGIGRLSRKVAKYIIEDRINKNNINDCIKEFERMITDKHDGNIYEFKYEELWDEAKEIYDILKEIQNIKLS